MSKVPIQSKGNNFESRRLEIDDRVKNESDFEEIVSVWSSKDGPQKIFLKYGVWDDPAGWGLLLIDIARHVSSTYEKQGLDKKEVFERILKGFEAEASSPTDNPA